MINIDTELKHTMKYNTIKVSIINNKYVPFPYECCYLYLANVENNIWKILDQF